LDSRSPKSRKPARIPNEDEAAWQLNETGWIYVIADVDRAGSALHTLLVGARLSAPAWGTG
jgi:hypothetical protein